MTSAQYLLAHPDIATALSVEGTMWFKSLSSPDPTMILPVALGAVNLANVEVRWIHTCYLVSIENPHKISALRKLSATPTPFQNFLTTLFRYLGLLMIPVASQLPSVSPFNNNHTSRDI